MRHNPASWNLTVINMPSSYLKLVPATNSYTAWPISHEPTVDDMLAYNYIKKNKTTFKIQRDFNSNVSNFKCLPEVAFVLYILVWLLRPECRECSRIVLLAMYMNPCRNLGIQFNYQKGYNLFFKIKSIKYIL